EPPVSERTPGRRAPDKIRKPARAPEPSIPPSSPQPPGRRGKQVSRGETSRDKQPTARRKQSAACERLTAGAPARELRANAHQHPAAHARRHSPSHAEMRSSLHREMEAAGQPRRKESAQSHTAEF